MNSNRVHKPQNALIVGNGKVGLAVAKTLVGRGERIAFYHRDRHNFREVASRHDIVYLCISTKDDGAAETQYVLRARDAGKPVVMCCKGALANHFNSIQPAIAAGQLAYMASVGGGSRVLELLEWTRGKQVRRIGGVLNGTMTFLADAIARGAEPDAVAKLAVERQLCEPGHASLQDIVNAEILDTLRKSMAVFHLSGVSQALLGPRDFDCPLITRAQIVNLFKQHGCRLWVEITKGQVGQSRRPYPPGFWAHKDGWWTTGEFVRMGEPQYRFTAELGDFIPVDAQNMLVAEVEPAAKDGEPELRYRIGIGAGSYPTALSMVRDGDLLLAK